jgi:hypothetical protein
MDKKRYCSSFLAMTGMTPLKRQKRKKPFCGVGANVVAAGDKTKPIELNRRSTWLSDCKLPLAETSKSNRSPARAKPVSGASNQSHKISNRSPKKPKKFAPESLWSGQRLDADSGRSRGIFRSLRARSFGYRLQVADKSGTISNSKNTVKSTIWVVGEVGLEPTKA